jgi:predicted type IV restriction endonuclease
MSISEAQTRQHIIDKRLAKAHWDVTNPFQVKSELDIYIGLGDFQK